MTIATDQPLPATLTQKQAAKLYGVCPKTWHASAKARLIARGMRLDGSRVQTRSFITAIESNDDDRRIRRK